MKQTVQAQLTRQLREKEEIVRLVRRAGITLAPSVGLGAVLILVDFFLLAWWLQYRTWGMIGFSAVVILAALIIGRGWYIWAMNLLAITNQRIIDMNQHGLFKRTVAEASYDKIQDVRYTIHGVWQTLFKFGTIVIQTAGASTTLELGSIKDPFEVQQQIAEIQRQVGAHATTDVSAAELLGLVERLKTKLGAESFRRLVDGPEDTPADHGPRH